MKLEIVGMFSYASANKCTQLIILQVNCFISLHFESISHINQYHILQKSKWLLLVGYMGNKNAPAGIHQTRTILMTLREFAAV